jgi:PAS domain S-box-containing protein
MSTPPKSNLASDQPLNKQTSSPAPTQESLSAALLFFVKGLEDIYPLSQDIYVSKEEAYVAFLEEGMRFFDFEAGIINQIKGENLIVLQTQQTRDSSFSEQDFAQLNSLGQLPIAKSQPTYYHEINDHGFEDSPLLQELNLISYLGTPLVVKGKLWGSINFFSQKAHDPALETAYLRLLDFMAWVLAKIIEDERDSQTLKREKKTSSLFGGNPIGVSVSDANDRYIYVSKTLCELMGLSESFLLGKNWKEFIYDENVKEALEIREEISTGAFPFLIKDQQVTDRSGEHSYWIRLLVYQYWDESRQEGLNIGLIEDISRDKGPKSEIKKLLSLISGGESVARMGSMIWNNNTANIELSPGCFELYGWELTENLPASHYYQKLFEVLHPKDREMMMGFVANPEILEEQIRKGNPNIEYRIYLPDGSLKWIRATLGNLVDEQRILVTIQDITEEVQQREALYQTNKELEELIYTVSHDLRAPLRHVSSYAQMIQESAEDKFSEDEKFFMENVISSSARLGQMIDELLSYSRSRNEELRKEKIEVQALLKPIHKLFERETKERGIVWKFRDLPEIYADREMMEKVFLNLLSNAVKYTKNQPHPVIELSGRTDGKRVIISIKDNGAGFNMKYANKLFAVFQRLHLQTEFEGTGIGLANVHRIIQRHDGEIWAKGEVEQGAEFHFSLPAEETLR